MLTGEVPLVRGIIMLEPQMFRVFKGDVTDMNELQQWKAEKVYTNVMMMMILRLHLHSD